MTPLPKHLRRRWRYVAVEIESWPDSSLERASFQEAVWRALRSLLGDVGSAKTHMRVVSFAFADGSGEAIIRVLRDAVSPARAALATVTTIQEQPVGLRIRGVSGTIRACEEKYLGRQREAPEKSTVVFADADRPAYTRDTIVDVQVDEAFVGATTLDFE